MKQTTTVWAVLAALVSDLACGQGSVEETVVIASRYDLETSRIGNWVEKLTRENLEEEGVFTLEDALRGAPGVGLASNGQTGTVTSIFLRGTESDHTLLRVDGMRLTDANLTPTSFLGGLPLSGVDEVEVLRGPQGALYGSGAIGGVVSLGLARGEGAASARSRFEGGSFSSISGSQEFQGETNGLSYNLQVQAGETANHLPQNDFQWHGAALRLDHDWSPGRRVGMTLRRSERSVELGPGGYQEDDFTLGTVFWSEQWSPQLHSEARVGFLQHEQATQFGTAELDRVTFSLDLTQEWTDDFRTLVGVEVEETGYEATSGSLDESTTLLSLYLQQEARWRELSVLAGVRAEDLSSYGGELTGRVALAWDHTATGTIVRGSVGTGFRAPSFIDSDGFFPGFPPFFPDYFGNPAVGPERTLGGDLGVEQKLGRDHTLSVALFGNRIDNLIVSTIDPGGFSTVANVEEATTWGVEAGLRGSWCDDQWRYRISYTYLEANNDTLGTRLVRRPRHTLSATVSTEPVEGWTVGAGVYLIADRRDISNTTFAEIDGEDYALARIFTSLDLSENVRLTGRIENVLDEDYDEVDGFPGRGVGAFAGVSIDW